MKKDAILIILAISIVTLTSCGKVQDIDVIILPDPEKYELKITGDLNYEYSYDESKYVGVSSSGNHGDDFDTYLDFIPESKSSNKMSIHLYPPPGHERKGDIIAIYIKSEKYDPWTFNGSYNGVYFSQLPYASEYAEVSYWDGTNEIDYLSKNTVLNMSNHVKIKREGELIYGTIKMFRLMNFNSTKIITINNLNFQVRPSDSPAFDY